MEDGEIMTREQAREIAARIWGPTTVVMFAAHWVNDKTGERYHEYYVHDAHGGEHTFNENGEPTCHNSCVAIPAQRETSSPK